MSMEDEALRRVAIRLYAWAHRWRTEAEIPSAQQEFEDPREVSDTERGHYYEQAALVLGIDLTQERLLGLAHIPGHTEGTLGKVAYEAYRERASGVSYITGAPLPAWGAVGDDVRQCWEAAGNAVADDVREDGS